MLGLLARFVFAETAGSALNEVGSAIGKRISRYVDPVGAEQERAIVASHLAQAGLLPKPSGPQGKPRRRK